MTTVEVKEFLQKIKARYQEFKCDEPFIIKEWIEALAPYEKKDVYEKLNEHLENESVQKEVPKIQVLTKWLVPETLKKKKNFPVKAKLICRWCGTDCGDTYILSLHEEKCLRQRFVAKLCDKLLIDPQPYFGKLFQTTLEELNENYDKFILRVIEEEKKQHKLNAFEKEGIRTYYKQVLKKEGEVK